MIRTLIARVLERGAIVCLERTALLQPEPEHPRRIRFLHSRDESLSGELLLTMATLFGAWALRAETTTGSLSQANPPTWRSLRCPTVMNQIHTTSFSRPAARSSELCSREIRARAVAGPVNQEGGKPLGGRGGSISFPRGAIDLESQPQV